MGPLDEDEGDWAGGSSAYSRISFIGGLAAVPPCACWEPSQRALLEADPNGELVDGLPALPAGM